MKEKNMPSFTLSKEWYQMNRVDAVYIRTSEIMADPLFTKFTNIHQTNFSFWYVQNKTKSILLTTPLEAKTIRKEYKKAQTIEKKEDIIKKLKPFFQNKTVGINEDYLTATQLRELKKTFQKTKWKNISKPLNETRKTKTREEIKKIQKQPNG